MTPNSLDKTDDDVYLAQEFTVMRLKLFNMHIPCIPLIKRNMNVHSLLRTLPGNSNVFSQILPCTINVTSHMYVDIKYDSKP